MIWVAVAIAWPLTGLISSGFIIAHEYETAALSLWNPSPPSKAQRIVALLFGVVFGPIALCLTLYGLISTKRMRWW